MSSLRERKKTLFLNLTPGFFLLFFFEERKNTRNFLNSSAAQTLLQHHITPFQGHLHNAKVIFGKVCAA